MDISETPKIMPKDGAPANCLGRLWKLVAPYLLDASSLELIQTLLREERPVSPAELADRLGLEVDPVCELLAQMAREGIVSQVSGAEDSQERALYRLGEPFEAASPTRAPAAKGNQVPIVSAAGRDALYQHLLANLGDLSALDRLAESDEPKDIHECEVLGARVVSALRLIHEAGIGWGKTGKEKFYPLMMPPEELGRLIAENHQQLIRVVEMQQAEREASNSEYGEVAEARDACQAILGQLRSFPSSSARPGTDPQ